MILELTALISAVILHELGHYIRAKRRKVYLGWGLTPTPHVKISRPYRKKIYYLDGIIMSLLSLPLLLIAGLSVKFSLLLLIVLGLGDLVIFFSMWASEKGVTKWKKF